MNLSLHDPFTLALDSPEALLNELRTSSSLPTLRSGIRAPILIVLGSGHAAALRFNGKGDYLASGRADGKIVIW